MPIVPPNETKGCLSAGARDRRARPARCRSASVVATAAPRGRTGGCADSGARLAECPPARPPQSRGGDPARGCGASHSRTAGLGDLGRGARDGRGYRLRSGHAADARSRGFPQSSARLDGGADSQPSRQRLNQCGRARGLRRETRRRDGRCRGNGARRDGASPRPDRPVADRVLLLPSRRPPAGGLDRVGDAFAG